MPKQKDGRYRAKITVGHDADGKPIVKYASGRTKKELEAAKEELRRKYIGGVEVDTAVLFGEYVREWYNVQRKPGLSLSSRNSYIRIINNHLLPELADRQLRAITANELQALLNSKAGMCKSDIGYVHSILTNVFRAAYAQGIIQRDPAVALTKPSKSQQSRRALTDAEAAAALTVAKSHPQGLILYLLYYTGMRIGEVLGLQWPDIDMEQKLIHVQRDLDFKARGVGDVKTEYSIRDIPLAPELEALLSPIRGFGPTFVIQGKRGSHQNNSSFYRIWGQLTRAMYLADPSIENAEYSTGAKDKNGKKIMEARSILTPHYFRHNYATLLYDAGVDLLTAQRILGHASAKTTLDIYTHLSHKREHENTEKARNAFAKK